METGATKKMVRETFVRIIHGVFQEVRKDIDDNRMERSKGGRGWSGEWTQTGGGKSQCNACGGGGKAAVDEN